MAKREELQEELAALGRRLDARGLVAGREGNLSARLDGARLLVTGSGTRLGQLGPGDFAVTSLDGEHRDGAPPTSELAAHLACYRARDEIRAVVHVHAPFCLALTLRGWSLEGTPLPEAAMVLGAVPTTRFVLPGTPEGGEAVAEVIGRCEALLLDRHGALAVGPGPAEAVDRLETLEAVAAAVLGAGGPEALRALTPGEADRVQEAALAAGVLEAAVRAWRGAVPVKG